MWGGRGSDCREKEMNKEIINQTYYISVFAIWHPVASTGACGKRVRVVGITNNPGFKTKLQ